jgi:hypothetical protein
MMLNLLIAIISDTFERVIERKRAQFIKERATLISNMEQHVVLGWLIRRFFEVQGHEHAARRLHALRALDTNGDGSSGDGDGYWQGRLRRLKSHINEQSKRNRAHMTSRLESMEVKMQLKLDKLEALLVQQQKVGTKNETGSATVEVEEAEQEKQDTY